MKNKKLLLNNTSTNLLLYGTAHAVIDGICFAVLFTILFEKPRLMIDYASLIILYNFLAFGLQIIFGYLTDYYRSPRVMSLTGCVLVGCSSLAFIYFPVLAIIMAGIGNAMFHVGGGSISLNLTPGKATAPGIFVAPGAIGVFVGTLIGKTGQFFVAPSILILVILGVLMLVIKMPEMNYERKNRKKEEFNLFASIFFLVFLSIAVRSFVGMVITFPWKVNFDLLVILTVAVVLGKWLGGILADKYGWIKIAVGALIFSIPFLIFGARIPLLGIIGMFLFNITMPITLVMISNIFPGKPGFSFGTTCLALFIGAFPAFFQFKRAFMGNWVIVCVIIISASALYCALKRYDKIYLSSDRSL